MKIVTIVLLVISLFISKAQPQNNLEWKVLSNSPPVTTRYEDLSFIDPQNGWAVSGIPSLIRTTDGGDTWQQISIEPPYDVLYMRTVRFINPSTGFVGTLSPGHPMLITTDSGKTFTDIIISGRIPDNCKTTGL